MVVFFFLSSVLPLLLLLPLSNPIVTFTSATELTESDRAASSGSKRCRVLASCLQRHESALGRMCPSVLGAVDCQRKKECDAIRCDAIETQKIQTGVTKVGDCLSAGDGMPLRLVSVSRLDRLCCLLECECMGCVLWIGRGLRPGQ